MRGYRNCKNPLRFLGCVLIRAFNETFWFPQLTQAESDLGKQEWEIIFQKAFAPQIQVWPEGAQLARGMERGFQVFIKFLRIRGNIVIVVF